ncbi:hypothetical protein ABKN59_012008, partial [Abortiporus biennis]
MSDLRALSFFHNSCTTYALAVSQEPFRRNLTYHYLFWYRRGRWGLNSVAFTIGISFTRTEAHTLFLLKLFLLKFTVRYLRFQPEHPGHNSIGDMPIDKLPSLHLMYCTTQMIALMALSFVAQVLQLVSFVVVLLVPTIYFLWRKNNHDRVSTSRLLNLANRMNDESGQQLGSGSPRADVGEIRVSKILVHPIK